MNTIFLPLLLLFEIVLGVCACISGLHTFSFSFFFHISYFFFKKSVSGLLSNGEIAQEYAMTGVGLLAGSSILLLTVVWGTCVITGSKEFKHDSGSEISEGSNSSAHKSLKALLTGQFQLTFFKSCIIIMFEINLHVESYCCEGPHAIMWLLKIGFIIILYPHIVVPLFLIFQILN